MRGVPCRCLPGHAFGRPGMPLNAQACLRACLATPPGMPGHNAFAARVRPVMSVSSTACPCLATITCVPCCACQFCCLSTCLSTACCVCDDCQWDTRASKGGGPPVELLDP
eukprot:13974046-Alexandrium_andersonii.AAC.1